MAKEQAKKEEPKADGKAAVVLRPFIRNGTRYNPEGPNDRCSDYEASMFEGDNPLVITEKDLADMTADEARAKNITDREKKAAAEKVEGLEADNAALQTQVEELTSELASVKNKLEQYRNENQDLTARLANAATLTQAK